jgi:hypothetical protein
LEMMVSASLSRRSPTRRPRNALETAMTAMYAASANRPSGFGVEATESCELAARVLDDPNWKVNAVELMYEVVDFNLVRARATARERRQLEDRRGVHPARRTRRRRCDAHGWLRSRYRFASRDDLLKLLAFIRSQVDHRPRRNC